MEQPKTVTRNRLTTPRAAAVAGMVFSVLFNVYALKMAGVFMIVTCTVAIRTNIFPRWMAFMGYVLAVSLLLSTGDLFWTPLVFPLWVLLISMHILTANMRSSPA